MDKIKLFCIPYAGGSSQMYKSWSSYLDEAIELYPIELAGKGRRISEVPYKNMEEAVDDVYQIMKEEIGDSEYAVFGHSMGTIIVYELLHKLRRDKKKSPIHAFFSGRYPPYVEKKLTRFSDISEEEIIDNMKEMGGTPQRIFENREFLDFFISIIRNDYRLCEQYVCRHDGEKICCDITVLSGKQDTGISEDDLKRWGDCTTKSSTVYEFDGGHFFINDRKKEIINIINHTLIR